ncbi:flavin reductase family protein [Pseudomonas sp. S75]|nr:flavin reductase family protein [Pseudomonas sp. S30]MBK0151931.1 flavin reductase family protein [Pseudomonas sp. S75]
MPDSVSTSAGDLPADVESPLDAIASSSVQERRFSSRGFRDVLGHFPTGVAIVTTTTMAGESIGLTINSFASVSLDPPLITWNLSTRSSMLDAFRTCGHFGISFLSTDQEPLARRFAAPGASGKFAQCRTIEGPEGVLLFDEAVATLVCLNRHTLEIGDHLLFVGEVLHINVECRAPLVFHRGRFASLAPGQQKDQPVEGSR